MYHIFHDMPVSDLPEQMYFNQSIKHVNISVNIVMSLGLECMGPRFDWDGDWHPWPLKSGRESGPVIYAILAATNLHTLQALSPQNIAESLWLYQ